MAKITALPVANVLSGEEHLPIVQGNQTKRVTMTALRALIVPFLQQYYKGDRGDTGASNNTYTTKAALTAASLLNSSFTFAPPEGSDDGLVAGKFYYQTANFTGQEDDIARGNIVKLDDVPITYGALVREDARGLSFKASATAGSRNLAEKLTERVSALDHGAIADGARHPLSERYATLAAAQRVYPFVSSLDQTLDWAGGQKVLNIARDSIASNRRVIPFFPAGRYINSDSLRVASDVWMKGEKGTIFDNQNWPLAVAQVVNDDPNTLDRVLITDIAFHGGRHGISISVAVGTESIVLERCSFFLQTVSNFQCNRLLQTAVFSRCIFDMAPYGVYAPGGITNQVSFFTCEFNNHAWESLYINGGEGISLYACRMEAGGALGRNTIRLINVRAFRYIGGYVEGTHTKFIDETGSTDTVSIDGTHLTGSSDGIGGFAPYELQSDGIITIANTHSAFGLIGSANIMTSGRNIGLRTHLSNVWRHKDRSGGRVSGKLNAVPDDGIIHVATFKRQSAADKQMLSGTMVLNFEGVDSTSNVGGRTSKRIYHFAVDTIGAVVTAIAKPMSAFDDLGAITITIEPAQGATALETSLRIVYANARSNIPQYGPSLSHIEMDYAGFTSNQDNPLQVTLQ